MRYKQYVPRKTKEELCKSCIWLKRNEHCPFMRCIKEKGWVAGKMQKEDE